MELKDLVIDLNYAKKLKELGARQASYYYVKELKRFSGEKTNYIQPFDELFFGNSLADFIKEIPKHGYCSAFITNELMEILPEKIKANDMEYGLYTSKTRNLDNEIIYHCYYMCESLIVEYRRDIIESNTDEKLSNALAKLLIWCIENKYVEV